MIGTFKKEGAEIFTGLMIPPDWSNLWKQCKQQGWNPKIVDLAKAVLFSSGMEALGDVGYGIAGPQYWHPTFPYKSSLSGETCQEFADDYEKRTGEMWQQPVLHYITFEVAVDALKRTTNVDDKEEIIRSIAATKMETTIAGPIDFTAPVDMAGNHPVQNVVSTPLYGGQWIKGTKYPFDLKIVSNAAAPDVTVQGKLESLV
jgi:branched-chain amino acid transport system substrate-binding protein